MVEADVSPSNVLTVSHSLQKSCLLTFRMI
jgi:hypothetical protein